MQTKKRPARASAQMKKIYRRRQIVALLALLVALAAVISLAWATVKSVSAVGHVVYYYLHKDQLTALNKDPVPSTVMSSGIADCDGDALTLSLTAAHSSVQSGSAMHFVATIAHRGQTSCLVDGSTSSRVLTISSGGQKVWSSDLCPVAARELLMTDNQEDIQTLTWDTTASSSQCKAKAAKPAAPGTYQAQLSINGISGLTSQTVTFEVTAPPAPKAPDSDKADKTTEGKGQDTTGSTTGGTGTADQAASGGGDSAGTAAKAAGGAGSGGSGADAAKAAAAPASAGTGAGTATGSTGKAGTGAAAGSGAAKAGANNSKAD